MLKPAKTVQEFMNIIPQIYKVLRLWKQRLANREFDPFDLVIQLKSHVGEGKYQSRTVQALVVQRYKELGRSIGAEQNMRYIVRDDKSRATRRILI